MPYYNSLRTLTWAVASLLVQSFDDWELILVDDGSDQDPVAFLNTVSDSRIKYTRLRKNYGRGVARQISLEQSKGQYIGMLDADDWSYPNRLKDQIDVLAGDPMLALVSSGMAVTDVESNLLGIRGNGKGVTQGPFRSLSIPFSFPASLIRRDAIGQANFDRNLLRGQDTDFLLQFMRGHTYHVVSRPLYSYLEDPRDLLAKVIESHSYRRARIRKHLSVAPVEGIMSITESYITEGVLQATQILGKESHFLASRHKIPTDEEISSYHNAHQVVADMVRLFEN